jgi:hypothetical protein
MSYLEDIISVPRLPVSKIILQHKSSPPSIGIYLLLFNVSLSEFNAQSVSFGFLDLPQDNTFME